MRRGVAALALVALLPAVARPAMPRHVAPQARDWTQVTTMAPGGGMVMGRPSARAKIVEYASMTCPHCAAFATGGFDSLAQTYIRPGLASIEVRTALRDRFDVVASLLARCGGPRRYFAAARLIFQDQDEWIQRGVDWQDGPGASASAAPTAAALAAVADGTGLLTLVGGAGITPAMGMACLADPARQKLVTAMADEAWNDRHIDGTPSFYINDAKIDGHDWTTLEPALKAALQ